MGALSGITAVCTPYCLLLVAIGVAVGIIFGAIPGLTAATAVALFLPVTFGMTSIEGIALLVGLYIGGISGGLISAILLRMPGTPSSIATCFDGHPMANRGEGGRALEIGIVASFVGGTIGFAILALLAPQIAKVALHFGYWEYFAIGVFSLTLIASMVSGSIIKGLASAVIGLVLSMVGTGPVDAAKRLTFGFSSMDAGFQTLTIMVGLFAITEMLTTAETTYSGKVIPIEYKKVRLADGFRETLAHKVNLLRSTVIGAAIGILPGIGGGTSNIISYISAKNASKHPEKFGTGIPEGIIASEAANNATIGGALIPLMTLGIPGDGVTALLLGALTLHGIQPGPLLFTNQSKLVYAIFTAAFIGNFFMLFMMHFGTRPVAKLLKTPKHYLFPVIMVLCMVGAYSLNSRIFDVGSLLALGVFGYILGKLGFSMTPIVLGYVLGDIVELNLRRALMSSKGNFWAVLNKPIACVFLVLAVLSIVFAMIKNSKKNKS